MNCAEARPLIGAYIDGELDLMTTLEVDRHLHTCADCARDYKNQMALHTNLRGAELYIPAPAALRNRVRATHPGVDQAPPPARIQWPKPRYLLTGLAAMLVIALVTFGLVSGGLWLQTGDDALAQEVVAGHVRSQITDHLMDVASSDQHTVKPWFNGKLNYSPPVVDLAGQGYPLAGGRLDYLDNRTVAALVYRHNQHVINVFVWPADSDAATPASFEERQGYNLARWTQSGMNFWAVSDESAVEFADFVKLLQTQITP